MVQQPRRLSGWADRGRAAPTYVALFAIASLAASWRAAAGTLDPGCVVASAARRGCLSGAHRQSAEQVGDAGRYSLPLALRDSAPQEPTTATPTAQPPPPSPPPSDTPTVAPTSTPAAKPTF